MTRDTPWMQKILSAEGGQRHQGLYWTNSSNLELALGLLKWKLSTTADMRMSVRTRNYTYSAKPSSRLDILINYHTATPLNTNHWRTKTAYTTFKEQEHIAAKRSSQKFSNVMTRRRECSGRMNYVSIQVVNYILVHLYLTARSAKTFVFNLY